MSRPLAPVLETCSSNSDSEEEEWTTVARTNARLRLRVGRPSLVSSAEADPDSLRKSLNRAIQELSDVLEQEGFWKRYDKYLTMEEDIVDIRAYGIGSPSNSSVACFQTAFLILLIGKLKPTRTYFFDPVINSTDRDILKEHKIDAHSLDDNVDFHSGDRYALFYMPHCDRTLYEWVLANRVTLGDASCILISNLLSNYTIEYASWQKMVSHLTEEPIFMFKRDFERFVTNSAKVRSKTAECSLRVPYQAFNDLAFVTIPPTGMTLAQQTFSTSSQPI